MECPHSPSLDACPRAVPGTAHRPEFEDLGVGHLAEELGTSQATPTDSADAGRHRWRRARTLISPGDVGGPGPAPSPGPEVAGSTGPSCPALNSREDASVGAGRPLATSPPPSAAPTPEGLPPQPAPKVPGFDAEVARGTPGDWNDPAGFFYWSRRTEHLCPDYARPSADARGVLEFLSRRPGPDGSPVSERLGPPEDHGNCWARCEWRGPGPGGGAEQAPWGWVRAWHGCKLEALYSILYHGRLSESRCEERGDRFFEGAAGVYLHKDGTRSKAENYTRFCPLFADGSYYASVFEVRVDRWDKVHTYNKTDQWVNRARSVRLAALWLCCRTKSDMSAGDEVAFRWEPSLEANPCDEHWRRCTQEPGTATLGDWLTKLPAAKPSQRRTARRSRSLVAAARSLEQLPGPRASPCRPPPARAPSAAAGDAAAGPPAAGGKGAAAAEGLAQEGLTPRAREVVRACVQELAAPHAVDPNKGLSFAVAKLHKCGLRSVMTLAHASADLWPRDKRGEHLLPEALRSLIQKQATDAEVASECHGAPSAG